MSSTPQVSPAPVLDTERALAMLENQEHVQPMIELLLSTVPADLEQIDTHLQADDRASAHRVLHQLKGFLPMFCAEGFGQDLREVTSLLKDGDPSGFDQKFPSVRARLQQLCDEAQAYLDAARG